MKQIEQTYAIKAPLEKVWQALTTAESAEQWGAGPASFDATEGGIFSYWDGDIHGINTKIVPEKLLEQDWYGHDHPEEKYRATFSFEVEDGNTLVHLAYSGHIYDEQKDIDDWREYYFSPIKNLLESKSQRVLTGVGELYAASPAHGMGRWMWSNHVQRVADKARQLAEKYGADPDKAYCAALVHDLADSRLERGDGNFATWSEEKGREVLLEAGWDEAEATEIIKVIVRPHSCHRGDDLPSTPEGKILATADAMWHLQTSFFPMLCYKHRPQQTNSYEKWQDWFGEKIERDFRIKIFFEAERDEVKADYEALLRVFGNTTLDSQE